MEDNKKPKFNVLFARGVVEKEYLEFLKKIFYEYNVIPVTLESQKQELSQEIDLVLFTGGEDVTPSIYGEKKGKFTSNNTERDKIERSIFGQLYYKTPKLGICRGAQFLTVMAGGKLIQHVTGHTATTDSIYYQGKVLNIPSDHHQMMYPFNLHNSKYSLLGHSLHFKSNIYLNGENENIELPENFLEPEIVFYNDYNALCIQSHPEWISNDNDISLKYISNLIKSKVLQKN